jgi:methionyl-tRNA formyltransferase
VFICVHLWFHRFEVSKVKIAIIGQQDFGKAVLEAFLARGDTVAGVFCAPEKEGAKPDPLKVTAQGKGLKVFQFPSLKGADAAQAMKDCSADIGIMAFVLQFAPQEFVNIPKHGTIQYHPSLLPKYRGPSSINWPIARGDKKTGLTIFRPNDGLDEGPVILQKETEVSENDTLGTVYFDRLFPMGVKAMLEAADLVVAGKHKEKVQDESQASYEGWFRANEAKVSWNNHVDFIHDTIRGADPAPGAWTTIGGKKLQLFGSRKHLVRTFGAVKGKIGEITDIGPESIRITAQGGQIEVSKVKPEEGKKVSAAEWANSTGISPGTILGN